MKKNDFKNKLQQLLLQDIEEMDYLEKMLFVEQVYVDYFSSKENEKYRDCSMKNKPWTEEELKIILLDAPTKANCLKYAMLFKRGYGSIEQIYRWSSTSDKEIKQKRPDDAFVKQIKKVSKEISLRA